MSKKRGTRKPDYKQFREYVRYFIDMFGLYDWHVYTKKVKRAPDYLAGVYVNVDDRIATIYIAKRWKLPAASEKELALHEVLEILISDLEETPKRISKKMKRRLAHAVIYRVGTAIANLTGTYDE